MLKIHKSISDDEFWLSKNQLIYQTYIPFRKLQHFENNKRKTQLHNRYRLIYLKLVEMILVR